MTIFRRRRADARFSYIDDVAPVIAASSARRTVTTRSSRRRGQPYSVNELATVVAGRWRKSQIKHLDARNEVVHAYSAHEKVREHSAT